MRILMTGHNGYLGPILIPMLLARGHQVTGTDIELYQDCTFAGELPRIKNLNTDVRDLESKDLAGFEALIHLAALSSDPLGNFRPELTEEINHQASVRLAKLAKQAGINRFLFASSCSNYGAGGARYLDEDARLNPITPYGQSKVDTELHLHKLSDDGFSLSYIRAGTVYGMAPRIRFDLVLNNLVAWAITEGTIHLKSDGKAWRPLVHVTDVARAYVAVLEAPLGLVHNQAFNVGASDENYQIRDLANAVAQAVPGATIEFAKNASADKRNYRVNCDKIRQKLPEYQTEWTVAKGIVELCSALKDSGLSIEDVEGPRFNRIAHLRKLIAVGTLDKSLRWTGSRPG